MNRLPRSRDAVGVGGLVGFLGLALFQRQNIVGCLRGIGCGAEDFVLVVFQDLQPRFDIAGLVARNERDAGFSGNIEARQITSDLFLSVFRRSESMFEIAIQAMFRSSPV